jgi:glycosyltransferase involved in cell wall biosynthesis
VPERASRDLIGKARVVVYPSVATEALGLTALDAALAGRPVVAADHPGVRELLGSGALLAPSGSVEELAAALDRVLGDAAFATMLGEAARRAVAGRHDPDAVAEATRTSYRHAMALTRGHVPAIPNGR